MSAKQIANKYCIECVRGKNSINGNPKYIFTFDDNSTVSTEANAGWVYGLSTCRFYVNKKISFEYVIRRGKQIMTTYFYEDEAYVSKWLCNECASPDIHIFNDFSSYLRKNAEMDCYCNDCKEEQYTVSSWWLGYGRHV